MTTIHLLEFPTDVWARAREHSDALQREFVLMTDTHAEHLDGSTPDGARPGVPQRLLQLVATLRQQYSAATTAQEEQLYAAIEAGETAVDDLVYEVPAEVGQVSEQLSAMFDEADEFCRQGQYLLTLATPSELVTFRRWFLGEFTGQSAGGPATPWPVYRATRLDGVSS